MNILLVDLKLLYLLVLIVMEDMEAGFWYLMNRLLLWIRRILFDNVEHMYLCMSNIVEYIICKLKSQVEFINKRIIIILPSI